MKRLVLFLLLVLNLESKGQQIPLTIVPLNSFHSYPISKNFDTLWKYRKDTASWILLSKKKGVYVINAYHPDAKKYITGDSIPSEVATSLQQGEEIMFRQGKRFMVVEDGYLIGINGGEWGGHILWYSRDGQQKYKVSDDQVIQFLKNDGHIYAIEGLNHIGVSKGNLIELKKVNSKWMSRLVATLPFAPFGICINDRNNFVIGTSSNVIEIEKNGNYKTLYNNPIWDEDDHYLYPHSMLFRHNVLYVAMMHGVFKYNLGTGKKEWLIRD